MAHGVYTRMMHNSSALYRRQFVCTLTDCKPDAGVEMNCESYKYKE